MRFKAAIAFTLLIGACTKSYKVKVDPTRPLEIAILHSYPEGEWYYGINSSLSKVLKDKGIKFNLSPLVFHSEFWKDRESERLVAEKNRILKFLKEKNPDIILMCDDEISDFIAQDIAALDKPVIFTGLNRRTAQIPWLKSFGKNQAAGTLEIYDTEASVKLLRTMKPSVKNFSILTSTNDTSNLVTDQVKTDLQKIGSVKVREVYQLRYWSEWKRAIEEINAKDDAVWVLVPYNVRDENGIEVSVERIGSWLRRHLKVPSLGIISISTKIGVLAGIPASPQALGKQMGEQVASFVGGVTLSEIGFVNAKYFQEEVNLNQARRLGLTISQKLRKQGFHPVSDARLLYGR